MQERILPMEKIKQLLMVFFVWILPMAFLLDALSWGNWTVEYYHEGKQYVSWHVHGFPFPSSGQFVPVQWYNSGESAVSWPLSILNCAITIAVALLIWYVLPKRIKAPEWLKVTAIVITCLMACFHLFFFLALSSSYPWVSDFKILHYHWSFFGLN